MKFITLISILLFPTKDVYAHGMSESDKAKIVEAGYLEYVELGATHMLTGYDHLLFLFGVLFFLYKFSDILKFITAFTLGHSLTLILATILGIKANYFLIDAVIALTVCYKGFDNLEGFEKYLGIKSPNLLAMVFYFGLIHGFGLSTRLQQLPLPKEGLIGRILSFNLGVELGQIAALSAMLLLLAGWRKRDSFKTFSKASNCLLVFLGGLLFIMQLHGYSHSRYSDEFPLNKDDHFHAHEEMKKTPETSALRDYPKKFELNPSVHSHADGEPHSH